MRRLLLLPVALLGCVTFVGCGGGDDDSGDPTATGGAGATTAAASGTTGATQSATTAPGGSSSDVELPESALKILLLPPDDLSWSDGDVEDQSGPITLDVATFCEDSSGGVTPPAVRAGSFIGRVNTENIHQSIQLLRPDKAAELLADTQSARDGCSTWQQPIGGAPWDFELADLDVDPLGDAVVSGQSQYTKNNGVEGMQDYIGVWHGDYVIQIWYTADAEDYTEGFAAQVIESLVEALDNTLERQS